MAQPLRSIPGRSEAQTAAMHPAMDTEDVRGVEQAYSALKIGFVVAPLVAGLDKFFNLLVEWPMYLAPFLGDWFGAQNFMYFVGVVEVIAAIGVALKPRIFGYVVSAWLVGIVVNLVILGDHWDIALRDVGLAIGAFALARLAQSLSRNRVERSRY